jgi:hypothetical protein
MKKQKQLLIHGILLLVSIVGLYLLRLNIEVNLVHYTILAPFVPGSADMVLPEPLGEFLLIFSLIGVLFIVGISALYAIIVILKSNIEAYLPKIPEILAICIMPPLVLSLISLYTINAGFGDGMLFFARSMVFAYMWGSICSCSLIAKFVIEILKNH